jgi:alpha 1,3-glucosidase
MWQQASTAVGETRRSVGGQDRPFVLSRAFFAGSQKYGAIWTGDNKADWGHLKASVPMILGVGMGGLPFAGADMGGFFGNPDSELLQRWYQAGAFQPFMRAHAHLDTKRREPYLFEGAERDNLRRAVETRYTYLSFWYTLFFETTQSGLPVMRPLWIEYPDDAETFAIEDNHIVGSDLLVATVSDPGATSVNTYFPGAEPWYDIENGQAHAANGWKLVAAPLRKTPVFQRGGSIIARKMRLRRASTLMHHDPFTFDVALNNAWEAAGSLFVDDYATYAYTKDSNKFAYFKLAFTKTSATTFTFSAVQEQGGDYATREWVEKINVVGFPFQPASVASAAGGAVEFEFAAASKTLTIKKPSAVLGAFSLTITL